MDKFMQAAIDEAPQGLAEGGIPIGSVLVHNGQIIGRGHNRLDQGRSGSGPLQFPQAGDGGAARAGDLVLELARMELLLVQQGCGAGQGAVCQVMGQHPRQACSHGSIGQGFSYHRHKGGPR